MDGNNKFFSSLVESPPRVPIAVAPDRLVRHFAQHTYLAITVEPDIVCPVWVTGINPQDFHHVQAHHVPINCFLAAICHLVVKTSAVTTGRHLSKNCYTKTAITQHLLHSNGNPTAAQTLQTPCSSCLFATYVLVARRDCNGSGFSKRVFRLWFFLSFPPMQST